MRILLVDDDEALMEILAESLIRQRYAVDIACNGETAQEFLALFSYDILVLDMLLPDIDGITLCKECRRQGTKTPILMLTAKKSNLDKVKALDAGADDYVVKPFDFDELCARIRALLRRDSQQSTVALGWGLLTVNPNTFEVSYDTHVLRTTPKEYALLELFLRHPERVFSLDAIIDNLWSFDDPPSADAVRTHIKGLRQKLKAGGAPKNFIETVYGVGYRLKALDDGAASSTRLISSVASKNNASPPNVGSPETMASPLASNSKIVANTVDKQDALFQVENSSLTTHSADLTTAIATAWLNHKSTMEERLKTLEDACIVLEAGNLSESLRQSSQSQAHKLAGSLGCFGFPDGSRIAAELEQMLKDNCPLNSQQTSHFGELVASLTQVLDRAAPIPGNSETQAKATIEQSSTLLLLTTELSMSETLKHCGAEVGFRCVVGDMADSQSTMVANQGNWDGVILWITTDTYEKATESLKRISSGFPHVPILVLTDILSIPKRLDIVRLGGDRILPLSLPPEQVMQAMHGMIQLAQEAFKVLILDDDDGVLALVETILSPWGWHTTTLNHPPELWLTLERVQPHLLILDVEMPEFNGLQLCQLLRADEQWRGLPIMFLTAHEDTDIQHQAFDVGADDFIPKAQLTTTLPNRIFNRLKRSRVTQA